MKLILACDPNGGIGYQNKLPWSKIEGDLPRFKHLTSGQNILMGRKTWESLPKKPLPNRTNYVYTSNPFLEGAVSFSNINFVKQIPNVWLIGGAQIIETCWQHITQIHLSKTFSEYTCDKFINLVQLEKEFQTFSQEDFSDHSYIIYNRKLN